MTFLVTNWQIRQFNSVKQKATYEVTYSLVGQCEKHWLYISKPEYLLLRKYVKKSTNIIYLMNFRRFRVKTVFLIEVSVWVVGMCISWNRSGKQH